MMMRDEEKIKYYVKKITLYGEFADDKECTLFTKFIEVRVFKFL